MEPQQVWMKSIGKTVNKIEGWTLEGSKGRYSVEAIRILHSDGSALLIYARHGGKIEKGGPWQIVLEREYQDDSKDLQFTLLLGSGKLQWISQ